MIVAGCASGADDDRPKKRPSSQQDSRADSDVADGPVTTGVFASTVRVTRSVDIEDGADRIDLTAARGEAEGSQVIVQGVDRAAVGRLKLRASVAGIPAESIQVLLEQPIEVKRSSPHGSTGLWYDALVPAAARHVTIRKNKQLVLWIDVAVPLSATPGMHRGALEIVHATSGKVARRIPIALSVSSVQLPRTPTVASSIGLDASQLVRFEGVSAGSVQLRAKLDQYFSLLAAARLSPADPNVEVPGSLPSAANKAGDTEFLIRTATRRGVSTFRIPFYMDYPFADPLGADRPAAIAYLRKSASWLRSKGILDRSYVYAIDEPARGDEGRVRELRELVRQADPDLRLLVTIDPSGGFRGLADIFAPNIGNGFRPADVAAQHRLGNEMWMYPSVSTWAPYPTLFIDDQRASPRALGWLARRYDVDGVLYWSATHWHEVKDPYRESATYRETGGVGNGDGSLMYPGRPVGVEGPVASVRLLQLRDGLEDADLMALAAARSAAGQRVAADVARRLAPTQTEFTSDGAVVAAQRARLFRALR